MVLEPVRGEIVIVFVNELLPSKSGCKKSIASVKSFVASPFVPSSAIVQFNVIGLPDSLSCV